MPLLASLLAATLIPVTAAQSAAQIHPRIATDGINRVAVWEEGARVLANGLGPDGQPFGPNAILISSPGAEAHSPAIAALPGLFFIVWVENTSLVGTFYSRDLQQRLFTIGGPLVLAPQAEPFYNAPRLAFDENKWVVTWVGTEQGHFTAHAVQVDFTGAFLNVHSPTAIDDPNDLSVNSITPDAAWRGSRPVFTWVRFTTRNGIPLRQSIAVGDAAGVQLVESAGPGIENRPRIAASSDGNSVLVTWLRDTALIARINPDLAAVLSPAPPSRRHRVVASPGPPQLTPVAAPVASYTLDWDGAAFEIVWQRPGDPSIMRTTIDERGTNVSTSLLTHIDDPAAVLEDSIDATTLLISSNGRLFWLLP